VAVDDLLYLDHFPHTDEKMPVLDKARDGGGLAGTALVAATRLGASAAWAGVLGFDELSLWTLDAFMRAKVDTTAVIRFGEARPFHSIILVDRSAGTRAILFTAEGVTQMTADEVTPDLIEAAGVVFLDHTVGELAVRILELAQRLGVPTVADLERLGPGVPESIAGVDHLIVGRGFAALVTGQEAPEAAVAALAALRPGRALTAVTAGAQGCWGHTGDGRAVRTPALCVDVVDSTGCGDVFHGAYAVEIARGESVERALRVASVVAGLKATRPGGRQGIPDRAEVEAQLKAQIGS
jgi:sugar/nucleoside kinase (ribokinase family)